MANDKERCPCSCTALQWCLVALGLWLGLLGGANKVTLYQPSRNFNFGIVHVVLRQTGEPSLCESTSLRTIRATIRPAILAKHVPD